MKTFQYTYITLALAFLVSSCGEPDKKAQLEELKKQQSELTAKIVKLEEEIQKTDTAFQQNAKAIIVGFEDVKKQSFTHYLEVQGKIDSDKNIRVSSQIGGPVQSVYVVKGQQVEKGAMLARTDGQQIQKSIDELDNRLELATEIYEKQKRLWDQKIGTEVQYLQAKNNKEALERSKATLQEQYSKTIIRAPFAGVIDEVYTKEGEMLTPGMPAFRLVNSTELKLVADISEAYVGKIKANQEAIVEFPDLGKSLPSKVVAVGDVIDPVNRTYRIDLALKQDKNQYKANMISYVKIKDYTNPSVIVIPVNLIQRSNDQSYVYVVSGNKASKKVIKTGRVYKNSIEVTEGLAEGDKLITLGYQDLVDGQTIKFE